MELRGQEALVVGLGRSGQAAARLLRARGALVRVVDRDEALAATAAVRALREEDVKVELGAHRTDQLGTSDFVVVSPGVPPDVAPVAEARRRGVPVLGELELGARLARGRLLAVTGSNGKSTTVTLAAAMLRAGGIDVREGGNLGRPACAIVLEGEGPETRLLLEVSSFQCETLDRARFSVVALLNVSPDHLDRHADLHAYAEAKLRLLSLLAPGGVAVLPKDDPILSAQARRAEGRVAWFGTAPLPGPGVALEDGRAVSSLPEAAGPLFEERDAWSRAPHDMQNALAAAAVALLGGADAPAVRDGLESFHGLPHRRQRIRTAAGPRAYDDSKATNVAAAVASIRACARGAAVILGGRHKGGDLAPLREALVEREAGAVLVGEARAELEAALSGAVETRSADDMETAVAVAFELTGEKGEILLAPACASFDMFTDFAARGEAFARAVRDRFGAPDGEAP